MIPQEKLPAVTRALQETFDVTSFEDIRQLTKGRTSALVFGIVVKGSPFLLRIIMRSNTVLGSTGEFTCMRAAAEAGLSPQIHYTNMDDGVSITDFIEEAAFASSEALIRMPATLRTLHALPPFPTRPDHFNTSCLFLLNKGPALDGFLQKFHAANLLSPSECEQLFAWHAQIAAVYPRDPADLVSSHNDLFKPDNILFDGNRVWLVDWEAAFLNDRYADLAVVANMIVTNDAEERAYLQTYLGQPPDQYQLARLFLMRQIAHIFYVMAFLFSASTEASVNQIDSPPDIKTFQQRFWSGEIPLDDHTNKTAYARFHWNELIQNVHQSRFAESLQTVQQIT